MKIIKKGRKQQGWAKEFECTGEGNGNGGCGAILLVEQKDVYITTSCARDEVTKYHTFRCAQCGVETDIPKNIMLPFTPRQKFEKDVEP